MESPEKIRIEFRPSAGMDSYRGQGIDTRAGQLEWTVERQLGISLIKTWPGKWRRAQAVQPGGGPPLVTAVMPTTLGREAMARNAIDNFLKQDWPNKELVIVNEGDAFLALDTPGIREVLVPRGRHNGWMRNVGDRLADGDYIIRWDDDDIHHPGRITAQMNPVETFGAVATTLKNRVHYFQDDGSAFVAVNEGHGLLLYRNEGRRYFEEEAEYGGTDSAFFGHYQDEVYEVDNWPGLYTRIFHGGNICSREHIASGGQDLNPGEWRLDGKWNAEGLAKNLAGGLESYPCHP